MKRLLNIDRPGGFPLCAETLGVLNENSEMLSEWLKGIPLKNRQAVLFRNKEYMVVCQNLQNRVVKVGSVATEDFDQCRVTFSTQTYTVHDNSGNEIADVWQEETASIVTETSPGAKWTIFGFEKVFETRLWRDSLPEFAAMLSGSTVSGGSFIAVPALYGQGNIMRSNTERLQLKLAIEYTIRGTHGTVLSVPIPAECPDGTRVEADLEVVSTGEHYPVRAYVSGGMLKIDIGRWLKDDIDWHSSHPLDRIQCHDIVRINKEVIL